MSAYGLEAFLRDLGEAAAQADARLAVEATSDSLRRLITGHFFLDTDPPRPAAAGFARQELHRDPAGRFLVVTCAWAPKQATPIHDHAGWGVVAAVSGRVLVTTYRRLDDRSTPGFASIAESSRQLVSDSAFASLRAPEEDIHHIENTFRDAAVTLHVFAGEAAVQSVYDTRAKSLMAVEGDPCRGV